MLTGYTLRGIEEDYLLVFRTDDPECILRIITRLQASRDKEIRALAEKLELDWNQREFMNKEQNHDNRNRRQNTRSNRKAGPKEPKASTVRK